MSKRVIGKLLYGSSVVVPFIALGAAFALTGLWLLGLIAGISTLAVCLFAGRQLVRSADADESASERSARLADESWNYGADIIAFTGSGNQSGLQLTLDLPRGAAQ